MVVDTFRLDRRLALVTGSSGGIGFALARGLGQAGAILVLNGRDKARLEHAARVLRDEGLTVHTRCFDVTDAAAVQARFAQATAPWLFGLAIDRFGAGALWFSATLGLVAFAALMLLHDPASARPQSSHF